MYIVQYSFFPVQYYQGNKKSFIHAMGEIYNVYYVYYTSFNCSIQKVPPKRMSLTKRSLV